MVERQLPKLHTRVRFPSPAPIPSRVRVFHVKHSSRATWLCCSAGVDAQPHVSGQASDGAFRRSSMTALTVAASARRPRPADRSRVRPRLSGHPARDRNRRRDRDDRGRPAQGRVPDHRAGDTWLAGASWPSRIERLRLPPAACVTARALAPLADLIAWHAVSRAEAVLPVPQRAGAAGRTAAPRHSETFDVDILPTAGRHRPSSRSLGSAKTTREQTSQHRADTSSPSPTRKAAWERRRPRSTLAPPWRWTAIAC